MSLHQIPVTHVCIFHDRCQPGQKYVVEQYSQDVKEPARYVALNMKELLLRVSMCFGVDDVAALEWIKLMEEGMGGK